MRIRRIWALLLVMLMLTGCGALSTQDTGKSVTTHSTTQQDADAKTTSNDPSATEPVTTDPTQNTAVTGTMTVTFLDVGQGDCTLITCDGQSMLIDAGDNTKGTAVQMYLNKQNITELADVIGTHTDEDHIGGMDVVLTKFPCGNVFLPNYKATSKTYKDVIQAISYKNYMITEPVPGNTYRLGSATFKILTPQKAYKDSNNNSIAILLTHGENTFLLTGDCEEEAESDMLAAGMPVKADVYKAGHHGSNTASSEAFMKAVNPEYAVISCGEGNSYGHPHAETLNRFRQMGIKVFRTDEEGTIIATSDGKKITWNMDPSVTWKAGEKTGGTSGSVTKETTVAPATIAPTTIAPTTVAATVGGDTGKDYVLNTESHKFHLPSCSYLPTTNRQDVHTTRDALIQEGYEPCKRCNP